MEDRITGKEFAEALIKVQEGKVMDKDLVVIEESQMQTAKQVKAQVQRIQQVMASIMKDGTHYGTVPGCGDKKVLLKPGAEVLMTTFRLAVDPQVEEIPTKGGFTYRVKAVITSQQTGLFLGAGIGEASTKEEKYHWQKAINQVQFDATPEDERRIKYGYDYETNQVLTNPADKANTVLKMAKKRALVDAVLTITAASDIFTQDLEDDPEDDSGKPKPKKTDSVKPKGEGGEGSKDVRESLREAIMELCDGDMSLYDKTVREYSGFGKGDNHKCIDGFQAIDTASEKWCGTTLGKVRKALEKLKEGGEGE